MFSSADSNLGAWLRPLVIFILVSECLLFSLRVVEKEYFTINVQIGTPAGNNNDNDDDNLNILRTSP